MYISPDRIFQVSSTTDFEQLSLEIFHFQAKENRIYREFLQHLHIHPERISSTQEIPFMPVELFKSHRVLCGQADAAIVFTSSGTTGSITSRHYVSNLQVYEKSFTSCFELFYGPPSGYCILALLPSYLEREGSSLVYMADRLIRDSGHPLSGFYKNNYEDLMQVIEQLKNSGNTCILLGVTYALIDLADNGCKLNEQFIVMETGGMKGKRREMPREELHEYLCQKLEVECIHSEYGMTELLSQAYSRRKGLFECPPWMQIRLRDIHDPFSAPSAGKSGGVNIIDLANLYSCSFIASKDIGRLYTNNTFEILGRFDNSDIRGCNLMVEA